MNFNEEMKEKVAVVNEVIAQYLPAEEGYQKTLLEAMNYSMMAGGKRIRPLLMQQTYYLFGGESKIIEPFMAGIEMIHTHSLIHDDLPAMDNDEYRRGRKTTHVVYGEAMGILSGDGLLNFAYETASRAFQMEPGNICIGQALRMLSAKTGIYGMIGGQSVDVEAVGKPIEKERLDFIYRLKTSALIEGSMMAGAILAGAGEEEVSLIKAVASDIGLAFQIQDDILDVTSTTKVLGKPVKSDEKNHKTTYVSLRGLEQAKEDVEVISRRAMKLLDSLEQKNIFLKNLILELISRKN